MVPPSNSRIVFWLLLAICAGFSAHAYTGYGRDYDQSPISYDATNDRHPYDATNDRHPASKEDFPRNDQADNYYNSYEPNDSVASTTSATPLAAPPRSGSSRRDGWTPIIRSQTTSDERYAKLQLRHHVDGVKPERAGSPRHSRTTYRGYGRPQQLRHFQPPNHALKVERASAKPLPPKDDLGSDLQHRPRRKEALVLSEDDVMWMHYGPQMGGHYRQLRDESAAQATAKIGQRSYEVRESYGEDAEPPPRNLYQPVDGSTGPTSAKMAAKRQTTTETWPADDATSETSVRTYKFGFDDRLLDGGLRGDHTVADSNVEGVETAPITGHPSSAAYAGRQVAGFGDFAASTAVLDDRLNSVEADEPAPAKSGRLLDSPIVIVEPQTTTLTPEYYRQLFDSFSSGHYRHADADGHPPNKKSPLGAHNPPAVASTAATTAATASASVAAGAAKQTDAFASEQSARRTNRRNETEKSNSVFFAVPGHQLMELLPETLRANLVAVKRVLIDCYAPSANNDTRSGSVNCFKKITFDILDKAIESEVVELTDAVSLVKDNKTASWRGRSATSRSIDKMEWLPNIVERIQHLFSTHVLKVKLMNSQESNSNQVEGRRRHYRRVFPIMVGAYMLLSSLVIPLGFKFMALLGMKSILLSSFSFMMAIMGGVKKYMGSNSGSSHPSYYPSPYPAYYPSYYDPWRRDEYRKLSNGYDDPMEFSHYTEEME